MVTGKTNWIPTKTSTICSEHFKENDFIKKKSCNRYLKEGTIPLTKIVHIYTKTDSLTNDTVIASTSTDKSIEGNIHKRQFDDSAATDSKKKCLNVQLTENSRVITPRNSTPSTPRKNKSMKRQNTEQSSNASTPRKRKLKNIISTKESIIKRQRLQIKKIQAQNRRLKKKNNKVEDILHNIQEKFCLKNEDIHNLKNINIQVRELAKRMLAKRYEGKLKQKYSQHFVLLR